MSLALTLTLTLALALALALALGIGIGHWHRHWHWNWARNTNLLLQAFASSLLLRLPFFQQLSLRFLVVLSLVATWTRNSVYNAVKSRCTN